MDENTITKIRQTLAQVVQMLAVGNYNHLETLTGGLRLTAEHMKMAITDYGRHLVIPPQDAYNSIDVIVVEGERHPTYSIRFRLFTEEEGRSDLELQATFVEVGKDIMRVELDGLLVA